LLAVGGKDKDGHAATGIHLYQPDTEEWVKVGDLPTPQWGCTCAMITDRELLVAGGSTSLFSYTTKVLITNL
jgi:N-acetylneuraminic acid mutarotase